jgi:hypothetical protein
MNPLHLLRKPTGVVLALMGSALFSLNASATLITDDTWAGGPNDCSGEFGQGFENCTFNESPIIAKYNIGGGWQINTDLFPTVDGSEWTFSPNDPPEGDDTEGTWTYTPGAGDPDIRYWTAKGGPGFNLFFDVTDPTDECIANPSTCYDLANVVTSGNWNTPLNPNNERPYGISHISFYDTGSDVPVPLPSTLALMGLGLLTLRKLRVRS